MIDVQRELEPLGRLIHSGLVYGSLVRDIDILLVVDDEQKVGEIRKELGRISRKLDKPLDVSMKSLDDIEHRIRHHDFNFGSALTTARFYLANQPYLERARESIFGSKPGRESVLFNFSEGLYAFDVSVFGFQCFEFYQRSDWHRTRPETSEYFRVVLENSPPPLEISNTPYLTKYYLGESVRNLSFSIGYLLATKIMQERGEVIDLNFLLSTQPETPEHRLFMENRKYIERYRSGLELDPSEVRTQIEKTRGFYEQYGRELIF